VTLVKICGVTHADDAAAAVRAGADRLGFVVEYPVPTPWTLHAARAAELMAGVPGTPVRVAVVGGTAEAILAIVRSTRPDAVQIHDDGPPEVVAGVAATGVPVVKALRVDPSRHDMDAAGWIALGRAHVAAGAAELLVDSVTAARPAGTGLAVDRALVREIAAGVGVPVVLAGGLTPGNVADAVREVRPACVDVISGVAAGGGRADHAKVAAFVAAVRAADAA
jgi:phosphoribosylanthranilate isomerase